MEPFQLTWTLERTFQSLEIEYTVVNQSDDHAFFLDEMYTASPEGLRPTNQLIVLPGENDDQIDLVAGFIRPPQHVGALYPTGARPSSAREQQLAGKKSVPLPLKAWHPWSRQLPTVDANAKTFRLVLGYVIGAGSWTPSPLAAGGVTRTLSIPYVVSKEKFLRGASKTI